MFGYKIYVWEDGFEMGFGVLVYFFEGIFFCDDGFDKRGTGISKIYFKEYFMMLDMYIMIWKFDVYLIYLMIWVLYCFVIVNDYFLGMNEICRLFCLLYY